MGVRGLTTYIASNHKQYLKDFKLHDCYVIIDGSSLSCQLYVKFATRDRTAFGGDYDRYAQTVREFFALLSKCGVIPIILFDGGYEPRKIRTVLSRMSEKLSALKHVVPASHKSNVVFPLMMKVIFKQVAREMGVTLVQCDFEADQEIASLARKYDCPVLSYDSDFYIFDVYYIPIPTLESEALPLKFDIGQASDKFYIPCKMYKVEFFLNRFGGLDKSMLPLLASLLGNDYVKKKVFNKFFAQFKIPKGKGSLGERKVARLIEWLRNETFDSAVGRVLGRMKIARRRLVTQSIRRAVNAYVSLNVSIEPYLPVEFTNSVILENPDPVLPIAECNLNLDSCQSNNEGMDVDNDNDSNVNDNDEDLEESDDESASENDDAEMCDEFKDMQKTTTLKSVKIPEWLVDVSRKGKVEPCIFDIMTLRMYFSLPQIEDNFYKSSHVISLSLLKKMSKLLLSDEFQEVSLFMRNTDGKFQRFLLQLKNTGKITDLINVPLLSKDERTLLLLNSLDIPSDFNVDSFPDDWKLYICAIIFWLKNSVEPQVTESHVYSLLICAIALSVVDVKIGYYRKKIGFLKKYGKLRKKIIRLKEYPDSNTENINDNDVDDDIGKELKDDNGTVIDLGSLNLEEIFKTSSDSTKETPSNSTTVKDALSSIDVAECIVIFETLFQFYQVDGNLRENRKLYSSKNIHLFAQFQSCIYHVMLLNALLGHPFEEPFIARFYSGTFIYNMCSALNKSRNVHDFFNVQLKYAPKILKVIEMIFSAMSSVISIATMPPPPPSRKRNRHRKKRKTENSTTDVENDEQDEIPPQVDETQEDYSDENNVFSLLSDV